MKKAQTAPRSRPRRTKVVSEPTIDASSAAATVASAFGWPSRAQRSPSPPRRHRAGAYPNPAEHDGRRRHRARGDRDRAAPAGAVGRVKPTRKSIERRAIGGARYSRAKAPGEASSSLRIRAFSLSHQCRRPRHRLRQRLGRRLRLRRAERPAPAHERPRRRPSPRARAPTPHVVPHQHQGLAQKRATKRGSSSRGRDLRHLVQTAVDGRATTTSPRTTDHVSLRSAHSSERAVVRVRHRRVRSRAHQRGPAQARRSAGREEARRGVEQRSRRRRRRRRRLVRAHEDPRTRILAALPLRAPR